MPKFLFVYRSSMENLEHELSPEQIQDIMQLWNAWIGEGMQNGWMVDPGDALNPTGKVINHDKVLTDGPFAESKEIVGGYTIVTCDDYDAAAKLADSCPHLTAPGCTVEIRQLAELASQDQ